MNGNGLIPPSAPGFGVGASPGPKLDADEMAFPLFWEHQVWVAECEHLAWEYVLVWSPDGRMNDMAVRCQKCHAPRCGDFSDPDPCMLVRHHRKPRTHRLHSELFRPPPALDRVSVEAWLDD